MSGGPEAAAADHAGAWHRLHPLSPLIRSGRRVLALLVLAGFGTTGMVGQGGGPHWYDLAIVGAAVVAAVVEWLVTRWTLDGSTLRIETGLLRRDSRQLPVARIQAVDVVRPFAARMLGLAELRVRLAGSSHADGRLAYLTEPAAEQLRARLLAAHHGLDPATPEPGEQVVTTVPTGRLIGSVVLPAIPLAVAAAAAGVVLALVSPAGLAAVAVPLGWWLIGFTTVTWRRVSSQYGFTVAASPDGIRIRRGLLGTVAETIPMQRVQAVRMIQPLLWRPWSWCRLEVDVAGHPGPEREEGVSEARKALLAVGRPEEAYRLVRLAVGAETPALTRPPLRARWRAPLSYHFLAAGHSGDLAVAVTGRVRRVTIWMPLAKAQSVRYVQGPLQRFLGLATVHLDAAGSHVHAVFAERTQQEAAGLVSELAALSRSARQQGRPPAPPPPSGPLTNRPVPLDGQLLDDGPPLDG
ncbi:MAG TPA: PH domain-containing protein, partial [Streptosporangiaceae bacterium]|nr:PH domain-containing protein [Streptosporangiaceae bacterium]